MPGPIPDRRRHYRAIIIAPLPMDPVPMFPTGQVYAGGTHLGSTCAAAWYLAARAGDALAAELGPGWSITVQPVLALTGTRPPRGIAVEGIPTVVARDLEDRREHVRPTA